MKMMFFFCCFCFLFLLKVFFLKKTLLLLISMEYLNLILFMILYEIFQMNSEMYYTILIFIILNVSEGVFGLCLFIKLTRTSSSDLFKSIRKNF